MARKISPFLMFEGQAEDAMRFYVSLFPGSEVIRLERYGPGEPGAEGSVKRADFVLAGQAVICIDSPVKHVSPSHRRCPCTRNAKARLSSTRCSACSRRKGPC